ncbi:MAG: integral rane protein YkoY family [Pseudomonadota bacterium]|jgi:predicted tellurium resistance membrane protein TerC
MFEWIVEPQAWIALATLTALEIVLGIDNIIFISILVGRLPEKQRDQARFIGLGLAMGTRILLLLSLTWMMKLTTPLFEVFAHTFSGRDLIMLGGGLFLIAKSTHEVHSSLESTHEMASTNPIVQTSLMAILVQIALIDIIFSLDSVITAVGMTREVVVMIIAVIISVGIMMFAAKAIGDFVEQHPTFKMLALSFLILVGVALLGEGLGFHIPKGYIYFSMAFSVGVEVLNMKIRAKKSVETLKLHKKRLG